MIIAGSLGYACGACLEEALNSFLAHLAGQEHRMSYEELSRQHGQISPNLLRNVLSQRLLSKCGSSSLFAGLDTLLGSGACSPFRLALLALLTLSPNLDDLYQVPVCRLVP